MMPILRAATVAGAIALALPCAATAQQRPDPPPPAELAAPGKAGWAVDARNGCWVWNPGPRAGEEVTWSGACPGGPASGPGSGEFRSMVGGVPRVVAYTGDMRNGRLNGVGRYRTSDGDGYDGEWRDGEQHGLGIFTWSNGDRFEGEWQNGQRRGRGTHVFANGDRFEGSWQDDRAHGFGRAVLGGVTYSGFWTGGCYRDGLGNAAALGRPLRECQ